jgi:hypothetical protein
MLVEKAAADAAPVERAVFAVVSKSTKCCIFPRVETVGPPMRVALVLLGILAALFALDELVYHGHYREAAWDAAKDQGAQIDYEIRYWIRRASR